MPDDLSQCGKRGQYLGVAIAEVNEVVRQLDFLLTVFNQAALFNFRFTNLQLNL